MREKNGFKQVVYSVSRMLSKVSGVALVSVMGLVVVNVALRFLGHPILGTYEFVSFLTAVVISLGLADCAVHKGHVAITLVADRFSQRIQVIVDIVGAILGTGLFLVLSWVCSAYAIAMWHSGEVSPTIEVVYYPFIFVVAFGFLVLALVLLVDLLKSRAQVIKE